MSEYSFSPSKIAFYSNALRETHYKPRGAWPSDAFDIDDSISSEFITPTPPEGKIIGVVDGYPSWVDAPALPNEELLTREITALSKVYKADINELNTAYLSAIVSDGPAEVTKQQIVREQISQRKAKYAIDIVEAKEKYPV